MAQGSVVGRGGWFGERGDAFALSLPAVTLLLLNLLDGLFTLTFLQLGVAQEANPIMRAAYDLSPLGFMIVKMLVVNVGVVVLSAHRDTRLSDIALKVATC